MKYPLVLCGFVPMLMASGALAAQAEPATEEATDGTEAAVYIEGTAEAADGDQEFVGYVSMKYTYERYEFSHSYPMATKIYPVLFQYLDDEGNELSEDFAQLVEDDYKKAGENGEEITLLYEKDIMWDQEADIPDLLSLSRFWYEVTGSPQGMYGNTGLLWNKQDNIMQNPLSLFTSAAAFDQSVQTKFCDKLDIEREKKRGKPIVRDSGNIYDVCIAPAQQSILLQSSNGISFDSMVIYAGPRQAGPYDEENYAIRMPITAAVMAAVKPDYKSSFSIGETSDSAIAATQ